MREGTRWKQIRKQVGSAQGVVTVDRVVRHDLTDTSLGGEAERPCGFLGRNILDRTNSKCRGQARPVVSKEQKRED